MLPIAKKYLPNDDPSFFIVNFIPLIKQLEQSKSTAPSSIKAKKYETLIVQIWELLPKYVQNDKNLDKVIAALIPYLERHVNLNENGLRRFALEVFSTVIAYCRSVTVVTDSIKETRKGLSKISLDYVNGMSQLYLTG